MTYLLVGVTVGKNDLASVNLDVRKGVENGGQVSRNNVGGLCIRPMSYFN